MAEIGLLTMSTDEIKQALSGLAPESPPWLAILSVLQDQVSQSTEEVAHPVQNDAERHFNAGRLSMVIDICQVLKSVMDEINKERQM